MSLNIVEGFTSPFHYLISPREGFIILSSSQLVKCIRSFNSLVPIIQTGHTHTHTNKQTPIECYNTNNIDSVLDKIFLLFLWMIHGM